VLAAISAGGSKGADLHRRFGATPFGWPKDAINGAILTLLAAGNIRATQDGKDLAGPRELPPTQIGKVTLYKEDEPPTVGQRLAVKGLLTDAGIAYQPGQEGAQIPALLQRLKDLAARAGGAPPLPDPPDTDHVDALAALAGNQLFRAVADDHERLKTDLERWRAAEQRREQRETRWRELERLLRHAEGVPIADRVTPAVQAILDGRQLLDDPDPVQPILEEVSAVLRAELQQRFDTFASAQPDAIHELEGWDDWSHVDADMRQRILSDAGLIESPLPDISTDRGLLDALDAVPLRGWDDRISLVSSRRDQARQRAAKEIEPESVTVTPPKATLKSEGDLAQYLADVRDQVLPHLQANKTVII